ncbi:hypothetical protein WJR50_29550 [Catalinimonas sp. 4WD22]|uniref:hypothetical protein n=1 Tax=Catalinimonas locisalis TaxID=3133978 RepID=UPI003100D772
MILGQDQLQVFENAENQNFSVQPYSFVYDSLPGFEEIPYHEIGLYVDKYRTAIE